MLISVLECQERGINYFIPTLIVTLICRYTFIENVIIFTVQGGV